jgi:transposase
VPGHRRRAAPDLFEPYAEYVGIRLRDDPHVWASALYDEVRELGFPLSYQRFTHGLRIRGLRPHCEACAGVRGRPTVEIEHPAGEEMQWDFLELPAPWGQAHLLVGTLSYSGKVRAAFCGGEDEAYVIEGIDKVLRRFGGTPRRWRFDRMSAVVVTETGEVRSSFLEAAKHYGAGIDVCPPRRGNRKGCVESRNHFLAQRWWRTARVDTPEAAQRSLDDFCRRTADGLPRFETIVRVAARREHLMTLPFTPYPATITDTRKVGASALVAFRGNRYRVTPGLVGREVTVRHRLGTSILEIVSADGGVVAAHHLAVAGGDVIVETPEQRAQLEAAVLSSFTTARPCRRKVNRPPSEEALAAAAALRTQAEGAAEVAVDLERYEALFREPQ